jgi:diguanylate cyclase (GGDEF)-like protein
VRALRDSLPLLLRFAILSGVVVVLLGLTLSTVATNGIERRAHDSAEEKARAIAIAAIEPSFPARWPSGMRSAQLDRIDELVGSERLRRTGVERLRVFNDEPRIVYSDDRWMVGRGAARSGLLRSALDGKVGSKLTAGTDHSGRGERMLEVYVPLVQAHRRDVVGVLEVNLPYAPVAEAIEAGNRRLHATLAIGLLLMWVALFRIVAEASRKLRRQAEENRRLAFHDTLTGLPNRALLYDRLRSAFTRAERDGTEFTVVLLDLDGFKEVNDHLGHQAGDDLLCEVADRLRALEGRADTVARLGGDEFAIVLADAGAGECGAFVGRLLAALRAPCAIAGAEVVIGASVGIAASGSASTPDELVRNADLSMYHAKASDQETATFEAEMHTSLVERRALEEELRRALAKQDLVLHYQPIVSLADGRVHALEALIRWPHPQRGLVAPGEFIPAAEQSGLIGVIGNWVLDEACRQLSQWRREGIVDDDVAVSINVSASQLRDTALPGRVIRALDRHELPARNLIVEITESMLADEHGIAEGQLHALRRHGVVVALDDFGTGYSSLSRLASLPVDHLKVDRSFVDGIHAAAGGKALAAAIIAMGRSLGLTVTAEGVENTEQVTALRRLDCDLVQGFLLARPVPAQELPELIVRPFPVCELTASLLPPTAGHRDGDLATLVA